MEKKTICEWIELAKENIDNKEELDYILDMIQERADAMESRLLSYCNAIEDLGFNRDGRDYDER